MRNFLLSVKEWYADQPVANKVIFGAFLAILVLGTLKAIFF